METQNGNLPAANKSQKTGVQENIRDAHRLLPRKQSGIYEKERLIWNCEQERKGRRQTDRIKPLPTGNLLKTKSILAQTLQEHCYLCDGPQAWVFTDYT